MITIIKKFVDFSVQIVQHEKHKKKSFLIASFNSIFYVSSLIIYENWFGCGKEMQVLSFTDNKLTIFIWFD